MKFETYQDALNNLQQYEPVIGTIPDKLNNPVKALIVGISDDVASKMVYLPNQEKLDSLSDIFPKGDLNNIEYWAVLRDGNDTLIPLSDILNNPIIDIYLKNGGRHRQLTVTDEWSNPVDIPRGLDVRLHFIDSPSFDFKIKDNQNWKKCGWNGIYKRQSAKVNFFYRLYGREL